MSKETDYRQSLETMQSRLSSWEMIRQELVEDGKPYSEDDDEPYHETAVAAKVARSEDFPDKRQIDVLWNKAEYIRFFVLGHGTKESEHSQSFEEKVVAVGNPSDYIRKIDFPYSASAGLDETDGQAEWLRVQIEDEERDMIVNFRFGTSFSLEVSFYPDETSNLSYETQSTDRSRMAGNEFRVIDFALDRYIEDVIVGNAKN